MRSSRYHLAPVAFLMVACTLAAGTPPRTSPSSLPPASTASQKDKDAAVSAVPQIAVPDKGDYHILLNGQDVGQEHFEISTAGGVWTAYGSTTMHVPGASDATATGTLKFSADGSPLHYEWSTKTEKKASGVVEFMGGTAKTSADLGSASPYTQDFVFPSGRIAILDNNLYHQYAVLLRLYDWKAGGKQSFPVLIPQAVTPGTIDVESLGRQQVEGATYDAVRVTTPDLEILLYLDASHRLMRLEVPASKVVIRRQ